MGGRKQKFETLVSSGDLAHFLKQLGKGLAKGQLRMGETTQELGPYEGLKLSVKPRGDSLAVKIKVKLPKYGAAADAAPAAGQGEPAADMPAPSVDDAGAPRYSALKKRMKKPWKDLLAGLAAGTTPAADAAAPFIADARLMITYPDKGDEYYPAFSAELDRLEAALAAGSLEEARAAAQELDRLKKECHERFK